MQLVDLYPDRGIFKPGETIKLVACLKSTDEVKAHLRFTICHLKDDIEAFYSSTEFSEGLHALHVDWIAPTEKPGGYGVKAELLDGSGEVKTVAYTAFDVQKNWTDFPRYGFITDFAPDRTDIASAIDALSRFHINGLQFYDWQYRHDELMPPDTNYIDPLGRSQSLEIVRSFIEETHRRGMAAMPYMAIYAASISFWRAHKSWALYDSEGQPLRFEDFLGLMDPSPESPWIQHIINQCAIVLESLPFDGLHVDQYGEPKNGWTATGSPVDIPEAFSAFIRTLKRNHQDKAVVFNAVGNWPIESLATAPQDFVYIEIWPPDETYQDVRRIVTDARSLSDNKPVVIALYIPAIHEPNILLADALIFSLGGSRIELGEDGRLLADPYFPKHQAISPMLKNHLTRYYDFVVRYGDFIGPSAEALPDLDIITRPDMWTVTRQISGWIVICLINFSELDDPRWNEQLNPPASVHNLDLHLVLEKQVQEVWWASPDESMPDMVKLSWRRDLSSLDIEIPKLDYWGFVAIELDSQNVAK